ncbi:hemerythrin domain-containing protein [Usitatibacter palustris]|uniref:Hemerythrin-like domain-containing protein n=1 Tax=Usitatibacter palustris TaxID=2732487 RepID=A0A6M4H6F5_9PROT|nr:hemerythrin domain-containing protein [Usitatibacter palustris]QJR14243.1 hypothetical protein DSM104440_01036 [Usitatibacter palustris]
MMKELLLTPTAGFDSPLEVLHACHERITRHYELIVRIAGHVVEHGADDEAREAARTALRFFAVAGRNHHLDEEEDLFPALVAVASSESAETVRSLVARLRYEHETLDALWAPVREGLEAIAGGLDGAPVTPADAGRLAQAYAQHIAQEEGLLIPLARHLLGAAELERLGRSMEARRRAK